MKKFYYYGLASSLTYVLAVILGGFMWQGYNHISQAVSELIMVTSPNQFVMQPLFWAYNLLLVLFSFGYYKWSQNKLLKASAISLFLVAFSGVMMLIFPQGVMGETLTTVGLLHLIFAGVAALTTLLAMFLGAFGFGKLEGYKNLKVWSLVLGSIVLVNGPLTAIAPSKFPQYFGLSERITIGSFIVWLFVVSYTFLENKKETK